MFVCKFLLKDTDALVTIMVKRFCLRAEFNAGHSERHQVKQLVVVVVYMSSPVCIHGVTHLRRSSISWKAFLMCVWLKVCSPPLTVSSSQSVLQVGRGEAGPAATLVGHERETRVDRGRGPGETDVRRHCG